MNFSFGKLLAAFVVALAFSPAAYPAAGSAKVRIGIIGASTVQTYAEDGAQRGWGQMLAEYLDPQVSVHNEALAGTSTKSFPPERWRRILAGKPDFVLIHFAHNDSKSNDPKRYAEPQTTYRENLRRYATEARAIGATPIFVTPNRRRLFRNGVLTNELQPYADAMKEEGAASGVAVIDLHASSGDLYSRLGEEASTPYTLNHLDQEDRPGRGDRTHFTVTGAREMALLIVSEFPRIDPKLAAVTRIPAKSGTP